MDGGHRGGRPPAFATWAEKQAELRCRLAARRPRSDHTGPLRLALGEVVERDGLTPRVVARQAFLAIAGDVCPDLLAHLAGAPLDELDRFLSGQGVPPEPDPGLPGPDGLPGTAEWVHGLFEGVGATWDWVRRWRLPGEFDPPPADGADGPLVRYASERYWGLGAAAATLLAWRTQPLAAADDLVLVDPFLLAVARSAEDLGVAGAVRLPESVWDPQREPRAAAHRRISRELDRALRAELGRIEAAARGRAAPVPAKRTGQEHLAWLARYHLGEESFAEIARGVGRSRQAVAEAVGAAADLVALPLRPASPAGRPHAPKPPRVVRAATKRR